MVGRVINVTSHIKGSNGVVSRSLTSSLRLRFCMDLTVGKHIVPNKPLSMNDELTWDDGTVFPEPCIDRIADTVGKFFGALGLMAVLNDKASKIPYTPKVYPYDNLRVELGGEP